MENSIFPHMTEEISMTFAVTLRMQIMIPSRELGVYIRAPFDFVIEHNQDSSDASGWKLAQKRQ